MLPARLLAGQLTLAVLNLQLESISPPSQPAAVKYHQPLPQVLLPEDQADRNTQASEELRRHHQPRVEAVAQVLRVPSP